MDPIRCNLKIPDHVKELTVGQVFQLSCSMPVEADDQAPYFFELPKEQKYQLQLQRAERNQAQQVDFFVVSYHVGENKIEQLQIRHKDKYLQVEPFQFQVSSVIDKSKTEKVEPYGPIGPLSLSWPVAWWIYIIGFITFWLFLGFILVRWTRRKRAFKKYLIECESMGAPDVDFYKNLRRIKRSYSVYHGGTLNAEESQSLGKELLDSYTRYLVRTFKIEEKLLNTKKIDRKLENLGIVERALVRENISELKILIEDKQLPKKAMTGEPRTSNSYSLDYIQLTQRITQQIDLIQKLISRGKR